MSDTATITLPAIADTALNHQCDSCPAKSVAVVFLPHAADASFPLHLEFCNHHLNRNRVGLLEASGAIVPVVRAV